MKVWGPYNCGQLGECDWCKGPEKGQIRLLFSQLKKVFLRIMEHHGLLGNARFSFEFHRCLIILASSHLTPCLACTGFLLGQIVVRISFPYL